MNGKNTDEMQEMIFQKGINWNNYESRYKRGRLIVKEMYEKEVELDNSSNVATENQIALRSKWSVVEVPIFTQDREFLYNKIPDNL